MVLILKKSKKVLRPFIKDYLIQIRLNHNLIIKNTTRALGYIIRVIYPKARVKEGDSR